MNKEAPENALQKVPSHVLGLNLRVFYSFILDWACVRTLFIRITHHLNCMQIKWAIKIISVDLNLVKGNIIYVSCLIKFRKVTQSHQHANFVIYAAQCIQIFEQILIDIREINVYWHAASLPCSVPYWPLTPTKCIFIGFRSVFVCPIELCCHILLGYLDVYWIRWVPFPLILCSLRCVP